MFDIIAYAAYAAVCVAHLWFLALCAKHGVAQFLQPKLAAACFVLSVGLNFAIFGLWLEWTPLLMFGAACFVPIGIYNFRWLSHQIGLKRVAAMHAEEEAFRAAKPAQEPRQAYTFTPNAPSAVAKKRYDPFSA